MQDKDRCPYSKVRLFVQNEKDEESQPFCKLTEHWCEGPGGCPYVEGEGR
jgi:hypothetical protein